MANQQEDIVPYEQQPDYEDMLKPGYRFRPTDSEIIVYYLVPKIETGEHPECRLHQVNIYDHNPDELAERYRPFENKWYYLTPRERKYDNGNLPNRITKDLTGRWKITQKHAKVYDDVSGLPVGMKSSFIYLVGKNGKTQWLMHEYTTMDPNLPVGSGQDGKKLTDWVLCKIYKKERNQSSNNNRANNVQYMANQEKQIEELNQAHENPSRKRQRLSVNNQGMNQPNCSEPQHIQVQEATHYHSDTRVQIAEPMPSVFITSQQLANNIDTPGGYMELLNQPSYVNHDLRDNYHDSILPMDTFWGSNFIQPTIQDPVQDLPPDVDQSPLWNSTYECQHNQSMCASSSTSIEPLVFSWDDVSTEEIHEWFQKNPIHIYA